MSHKSYSFEFIDFKLLEVDFKINKELDLNKEIEINTTLSIRHEWIDKKKLLKAFVRLGFGGTDSPFI
ncbi:MAG TPA: hypothetical protein PLI53_06780, partial [Geobacteraceae bacterium]|nr:hypothetical protein [Geobacteraceae bacterium]